ncbi:DUF2851 family protein [uncultured Kordia sp.]|uniref:DUF2851 family protein n=1 Tax=uncultured Kordia sp. TaxID=507699 RepID=UPI0026396A49|nr:DUF2851 family protein [uncultured Kordia sp.]
MTVKEDFLYYLWKFSKLQLQKLQTTDGDTIQIVNLGIHNTHAGPDFFNARIRIGNQLWAGNVEMHVNASDWFVHHHEKDKNYDNVILHVVWNHDIEIHRKDNSVIPTLLLKKYAALAQVNNYINLVNTPKKWINCETDFPVLKEFQFSNWIERLYVERLARKASEIEQLVVKMKHDWEAILFQLLAKGFGLKLNSEAFFEASQTIDFSIIRKLSSNQITLEAFLFGSFGLLSQEVTQEVYHTNLQNEFEYIANKFNYKRSKHLQIQFFRTRPANFPTIRVSQLAMLYHQETSLFSKLIKSTSISEMYTILQVATSEFWETHYTFEKSSPSRKKIVSKKFIDVLLINAIIPLKYSYEKYLGKSPIESILAFLKTVEPEKNTIIQKFAEKEIIIENALQTQALLELKKNYCDKQKCLECAVGNSLVQS